MTLFVCRVFDSTVDEKFEDNDGDEDIDADDETSIDKKPSAKKKTKLGHSTASSFNVFLR
jgi:hypothetical protein